MPLAPRVTVVGAGAFGGWTALSLLRSGAQVTLVERRDAGNALSSSGGESRVIRHVYERRHHVELAQRALALWRRADEEWGRRLFHPKGVLFLSRQAELLARAAQHLEAAGVEFERLDPSGLAARYPQIRIDDLDDAIFEPGSGYLDARRACEAVRDAFIREGGEYRIATVQPGPVRAGEMQGIRIEGGEQISQGLFVFACGPWLPALFPRFLRTPLAITRQEVHFFRTPNDQIEALNAGLPVWAVLDNAFWYGIPQANGLFKLANDSHGRIVDPETQAREPTPEGIEAARAFMESRFPGMVGADYVDSRVCQYTLSPDADFLLDRVPGAANAWLLGAGSGHGFKHGPAIGELAADCILGERAPGPQYALERFDPGAGSA